MGAPDLLQMLTARGLTLRPRPDGNLEVSPRTALTDELRAQIRAHKGELLAALQALAGAAEAPGADHATTDMPGGSLERSCAFLAARADAELAERPEADLVVLGDDEIEPGAVLIAVARRNQFLCVLRVDSANYDGVRLLELIRQHTVH